MLLLGFEPRSPVTNRIPNEINSEFIRTAFERCPSGLLVVDTNGRIAIVNEEVERLFGYQREQLLGQPVELLIPERYAGHHAKHRQSYEANPIARRMGAGRELLGRHRDGHEVPVEIGLSSIETPNGIYILSTLVDVTERRRIEERLRQTHKLEAVGNLASGIAHDFNNILLGIMGYAELVREAVAGNRVLTDDLDVVLDAARRGRDLVNRILSFTRQAEPKRVETHLAGPIHEALQLLSANLPPNVEIRQSCAPSTPLILADSMELHQIIMNLATNAAHAMRQKGGILEVRAAPVAVGSKFVAQHPELQVGLYVHLRVSDTGAGIAEGDLPRIFDPFFTTKPAGEGTGLGLSVILRIVRSLGGCIEVESDVGVGTRFDVYLPSAMAPSPPNEPEPPEAPCRYCVLLVEDEDHLAHLGKRMLESDDLKVLAYTSSLQAFETFRAHPERFDLISTDNNMPHMTGLELVARIRELRRDIPIMMVSGIADCMPFEELRERGVTRLLPKPYLAAELRKAALELVQPP
jgi:PAS domain S-box-containing protein